eukprot:5755001-Amphidinium_carterae.1
MGDNRDFAAMGKGFAALIEYFFGPMTRRRFCGPHFERVTQRSTTCQQHVSPVQGQPSEWNYFCVAVSIAPRLWRSCSSLSMILPLGGESVWGEQLTGRCASLRVPCAPSPEQTGPNQTFV